MATLLRQSMLLTGSSFMRAAGGGVYTTRRGSLTPKISPNKFYKGRGCKSLGYHIKHGRYRLKPSKLPFYEIPDLEGFELKPYVSMTTPKLE